MPCLLSWSLVYQLIIINKCDGVIFFSPCWQNEKVGGGWAGQKNENAESSSVVCIVLISVTYSTDTDIKSAVKVMSIWQWHGHQYWYDIIPGCSQVCFCREPHVSCGKNRQTVYLLRKHCSSPTWHVHKTCESRWQCRSSMTCYHGRWNEMQDALLTQSVCLARKEADPGWKRPVL